MTQAWFVCEQELKQVRDLLQVRDKQIELMRGEMKALQVDNTQMRCELLCSKCQRYIDLKQPGDTILALPFSCLFWDRRVYQKLETTSIKQSHRRMGRHRSAWKP